MTERANILHAKYIYRTQTLPNDTLFIQLQPSFNHQPSTSHWNQLCQSPIWHHLIQQHSDPSLTELKSSIRQHRLDNLASTISDTNRSKNLAACRPKLGIDPITWLPMTNKERSRSIRWRIGWLPGGKPKPCMNCNTSNLTKNHAILCFQMHHRLNINSERYKDPLSLILNQLPKSKPTSSSRIQQLKQTWPVVCQILAELDAHQHPASNPQQYLDKDFGKAFLLWIDPPPPEQN